MCACEFQSSHTLRTVDVCHSVCNCISVMIVLGCSRLFPVWPFYEQHCSEQTYLYNFYACIPLELLEVSFPDQKLPGIAQLPCKMPNGLIFFFF